MCLPMFPLACVEIGLPIIGLLSVIGIIYGSLCALAQRDIKKLVLFERGASRLLHGGPVCIEHRRTDGQRSADDQPRPVDRACSDRGHGFMSVTILVCWTTLVAWHAIAVDCLQYGVYLDEQLDWGLNGFVGEFLSLAGSSVRIHVCCTGHDRCCVGSLVPADGCSARIFWTVAGTPIVHHGDGHHGGHDEIVDLKPREFVALAPLAALCSGSACSPLH